MPCGVSMKYGTGLTHRLMTWLCISVAAPVTTAQADDNPQQNASTFRPTPLQGALLGLDTARSSSPGSLGAGIWFSLSRLPVRVVDAASAAQVALVRQLIQADVYAGYTLSSRLMVGANVPVFLQTAGDDLPKELGLSKVGGTSVGDTRLVVRLALSGTDPDGGLSLAISEDLSLPTATRRDFSGDAGVTATTRMLASYKVGDLQLATNLGYRLRKSVVVLGHRFGNELQFAAAAEYPLVCGRLEAQGALNGWTAASGDFADSQLTGLDGLVGAQLHLGTMALRAAAGGGILSGFGSPAFRGVISIGYAPAQQGDCGFAATPSRPPFTCPGHAEITEPAGCKDSDNDGILDLADNCPTATGAAATGGCPDSDGDAIADGADKCPVVKGGATTAGCPDGDGDGIADGDDDCATEKGAIATRGCPDTDSDGVADKDDKCPQVAGGKESANGCPLDRDGDGILDKDDKCPDAAGSKERRGCPELRVTVTKEKIVLAEKVFFDTGAATILKESHELLAEIAKTLAANPQVRLVRIEGHTDKAGTTEENLTLSEKRAQAVKKYLIGKGVSDKRLQAAGLGDSKPVADNATDEGRAHNRRVELHIVDQGH